MPNGRYADNVFMNCPFDTEYKSIFNAIIFAIFDCGYVARCALEIDDAGQVRIDKIGRIIADSKFGVHDISRTELDQHTELPRFNVPLELGMFLGAKRFGNTHQKAKVSLIIDRELYRYQRFMSDISGQDIRSHQNDPLEAIRIIRVGYPFDQVTTTYCGWPLAAPGKACR